uniref:Uncharacterized protein n=1 Tax=Avena sativa TaxID=4498 RepID=A0ACD5ZAD5_AVESA
MSIARRNPSRKHKTGPSSWTLIALPARTISKRAFSANKTHGDTQLCSTHTAPAQKEENAPHYAVLLQSHTRQETPPNSTTQCCSSQQQRPIGRKEGRLDLAGDIWRRSPAAKDTASPSFDLICQRPDPLFRLPILQLMDPAEIPQRVDRGMDQCADGEPHPPLPMSVSKVIDDDNLLPLIIVRVGFPTSLLRAALVCKRWLGVASDPAFLRDFRKLNPPSLLGFCADTLTLDVPYQAIRPRFVPMLPQPAELAVVARHLEAYEKDQRDIPRSADGFITGFWSGISTERGMASALPPAPNDQDQFDGSFLSSFFICLHSDGEVHGLSHVYSSVEANRRKRRFCTMNMYTLQDGAWRMRTSAATQLSYTRLDIEPLLVDGKIYMRRVDEGDILVLDLKASSFSTIPLPEGVEYLHENTMLSRADDSKVHLMHLKNLQLRIWLHNGDSWLLLDTICLRQLCDIPSMSDATHEDEHNAIIRVSHLGDNDEYVFLMIGQSALYLDIKRRALRKVYEVTEENQRLCYIHPFRMIWPPIFPALKDHPARSVM